MNDQRAKSLEYYEKAMRERAAKNGQAPQAHLLCKSCGMSSAGATVYNDPQEGPPRKHWLDFLGNCAFWVQLAEMPMVDANGNETARMKRIPTKPRVA